MTAFKQISTPTPISHFQNLINSLDTLVPNPTRNTVNFDPSLFTANIDTLAAQFEAKNGDEFYKTAIRISVIAIQQIPLFGEGQPLTEVELRELIQNFIEKKQCFHTKSSDAAYDGMKKTIRVLMISLSTLPSIGMLLLSKPEFRVVLNLNSNRDTATSFVFAVVNALSDAKDIEITDEPTKKYLKNLLRSIFIHHSHLFKDERKNMIRLQLVAFRKIAECISDSQIPTYVEGIYSDLNRESDLKPIFAYLTTTMYTTTYTRSSIIGMAKAHIEAIYNFRHAAGYEWIRSIADRPEHSQDLDKNSPDILCVYPFKKQLLDMHDYNLMVKFFFKEFFDGLKSTKDEDSILNTLVQRNVLTDIDQSDTSNPGYSLSVGLAWAAMESLENPPREKIRNAILGLLTLSPSAAYEVVNDYFNFVAHPFQEYDELTTETVVIPSVNFFEVFIENHLKKCCMEYQTPLKNKGISIHILDFQMSPTYERKEWSITDFLDKILEPFGQVTLRVGIHSEELDMRIPFFNGQQTMMAIFRNIEAHHFVVQEYRFTDTIEPEPSKEPETHVSKKKHKTRKQTSKSESEKTPKPAIENDEANPVSARIKDILDHIIRRNLAVRKLIPEFQTMAKNDGNPYNLECSIVPGGRHSHIKITWSVNGVNGEREVAFGGIRNKCMGIGLLHTVAEQLTTIQK